MSKQTYRIYQLLVDPYRRPSRRRNTAGRYFVATTSEQKAVVMLQKCIRFGSIQCIGTIEPYHADTFAPIDTQNATQMAERYLQTLAARLNKNDIMRVIPQNGRYLLAEPTSAIAPQTT